MRPAAPERPVPQQHMSWHVCIQFWMLCLRSVGGHVSLPLAAAQCELCAAPCLARRDGLLCFGSSCSHLHQDA